MQTDRGTDRMRAQEGKGAGWVAQIDAAKQTTGTNIAITVPVSHTHDEVRRSQRTHWPGAMPVTRCGVTQQRPVLLP